LWLLVCIAKRAAGSFQMPGFRRKTVLALIATLATVAVRADTLTVAVASNFAETLRGIASKFEMRTGHEVRVIPGSTGKLYAQIINGAPFDVFLSADGRRPEMLEAQSLSVDGTRFTYAIGQLVLWSRDSDFADGACLDGLQKLGKKRLAIANPLLAPYGVAAKEYLVASGLWEKVQGNLVYGENIVQTLQYAATGNASIALIANSQLEQAQRFDGVCALPIAAGAHSEILQQVVELAAASDALLAGQFLEFLRGSESRAIISAHGYLLPELQ
jgi:molybdate transport system substrate-binding protein